MEADSFIIELVEGYGGEDGYDIHLLWHNEQQIGSFKLLSSAKKVAEGINKG